MALEQPVADGRCAGRCFLLCLLVLGSSSPAGAAGVEEVVDCAQRVLAERFDPMLDSCFVQAIRAGGEGMEGLLAEEFSYNTARGTRVDATVLHDWLAGAQNPRTGIRVEELRVRERGKVALSDGVMVGDSPMLQAATRRSRYLHVWVREEGLGWRLLARQVTLFTAGDPSP